MTGNKSEKVVELLCLILNLSGTTRARCSRHELGGIPDKLVGRETGGLPPVIPKVGITAGKLRKKKKKKKKTRRS